MIVLLMLKPWSNLNAGETAGFDEATAEQLVQAGIAGPVPAKAAGKAAPAEKPKDKPAPSA